MSVVMNTCEDNSCTSEIFNNVGVVFHGDTNKNGNRCALILDSGQMIVYDLNNHRNIYTSKNREFSVCTYSSDPGYLNSIVATISGKENNSIQCIDERVAKLNASISFSENHLPESVKFASLAFNDRILIAGTCTVDKSSLNHDPQSLMIFWDLRMPTNSSGCYWQSHSNDVTSLYLHSNYLVSASTDGLVNLFDLTESSEDDALLCTHNCGEPIERVSLRCFDKTGSLPDGYIIAETCQGSVDLILLNQQELHSVETTNRDKWISYIDSGANRKDQYCFQMASDLRFHSDNKVILHSVVNYQDTCNLYKFEKKVSKSLSNACRQKCFAKPFKCHSKSVYAWTPSTQWDNATSAIFISYEDGSMTRHIL
ncbi:hypothetical protein GJ496_009645 [Pomphorhynchus laevis]|nr:hypothetical protein GJ496_009645 [Pomphorhynchus laevis]